MIFTVLESKLYFVFLSFQNAKSAGNGKLGHPSPMCCAEQQFNLQNGGICASSKKKHCNNFSKLKEIYANYYRSQKTLFPQPAKKRKAHNTILAIFSCSFFGLSNHMLKSVIRNTKALQKLGEVFIRTVPDHLHSFIIHTAHQQFILQNVKMYFERLLLAVNERKWYQWPYNLDVQHWNLFPSWFWDITAATTHK